MKKLFLLAVLFVVSISNLSVFGQAYPLPKLKSFDNTVMFQRMSETTATLKFENVNGYIITENLKNRSKTGEVITYRTSDGYYVKLTPTPFNFSGLVSYEIDYYNPLDRRLWSSRVSQ